ncbi:hypothetical protein UFOVP736_15 [uncultured Caudovirales phage]|uniref:Uncharacterized protein n=1 Tax=uncultured Caudovirales phage TaxID=2100421 RepID=A0A6J7X459_9CAUD|nr:hypothetical protein UFOVP705_66 [uncultured Caudovirales phage]CAB5223866.1 hypothetical protein UFOVP736_15 [uncultured Caudovirales phage]
MSVAIKNLSIEAGTTYRRTLRFYTDAARTQPLDLTGCTFTSWMQRNETVIVFAITVAGDPTTGSAEMGLEPEQTKDEELGNYLWDMLMIGPDGTVMKAMKGVVMLQKTVTKI